MDITVRFAERDELERVNQIREQVNELHVNGRPDIFRPGFCEEMQEHIYRQFESENSDVIVAVSDNEICGFATVEYIEKQQSAHSLARKIYRIEEFAVDTKYHRRGVATELVSFIKDDAQSKGYDKVELDMWEFNETAFKFYNSVGFKTYRRYMELLL